MGDALFHEPNKMVLEQNEMLLKLNKVLQEQNELLLTQNKMLQELARQQSEASSLLAPKAAKPLPMPVPVPVPVHASNVSCDVWYAKWNESRANAQTFVEFIHLQKAAGNMVESWLLKAWNGNNATSSYELRRPCRKANNPRVSDCRHYHGGHSPFYARIQAHRFVTLLREPLAKMLSCYNYETSLLSNPNLCVREPGHSFCLPSHRADCLRGTGYNPYTQRHYNASGACARTKSLASFSISGPQQNPTTRMLCGKVREDHLLQQWLRERYLVVGTMESADSVRAFLARLQYVLNPPHVVSPGAVLFNNALDEQHSASFQVMTERDLEDSELTRWREKNEIDLRLYEIARALDREQRYCFELLSEGATVSAVAHVLG